jgi:hypothetical protein
MEFDQKWENKTFDFLFGGRLAAVTGHSADDDEAGRQIENLRKFNFTGI